MKPSVHSLIQGITFAIMLILAACAGDNGTSATGVGNPGTYTITASKVEVTTINNQQILVQADQGFLTLGSDLSLSDTTIIIKRDGETNMILTADDFDEEEGHDFFSTTVPGGTGNTIQVDVIVSGTSTESKRVEAIASESGTKASDATADTTVVTNTATLVVDTICDRIHSCHDTIPTTACAEGMRLTTGLSDNFGIVSDTGFFFSELITNLENSTLTAANADSCLADIALLSCATIDTGFDINTPKMYENTGTFIPTSCGTILAGTPSTDRTVNALSTLVDEVCIPISFCGAISAKTCDDGLRLVTNLADNLGLTRTLSVEEMITQVETGALVVNESALDTCKAALEAARIESASDCEVYSSAYNPNNPTNFSNLEDVLSCSNLLAEGGS